MRIVLTTLVGLVLCQSAWAQPRLKLSANRDTDGNNGITVRKNERVSVQIDTEPGASIAVFCVPKTTYITKPDNTEVTFYAVKSVQFMIAAFKDGKVTKQQLLVTIDSDPTPPGPDPEPGPDPTPPNPKPDIPTSKIGKASYEAAVKVESPNLKSDAATMAKSIRATHAKAVAVATMSWREIIDESLKSVRKIPKDNQEKWAPWGLAVLTVLQGEVSGTDAEKRKKAITAIEEIAKGLEAVK